jgi:uncharacterized membrane protein
VKDDGGSNTKKIQNFICVLKSGYYQVAVYQKFCNSKLFCIRSIRHKIVTEKALAFMAVSLFNIGFEKKVTFSMVFLWIGLAQNLCINENSILHNF